MLSFLRKIRAEALGDGDGKNEVVEMVKGGVVWFCIVGDWRYFDLDLVVVLLIDRV